MYLFVAFVAVAAVTGAALLAAMYRRDEPILGVFGLVSLNVAGMAGSAYGVLSSA